MLLLWLLFQKTKIVFYETVDGLKNQTIRRCHLGSISPRTPELNVEDIQCYMAFDLFRTLRALISSGLPSLKLGGAGGIH